MTNYLLKAIYKLLDFDEGTPKDLVLDEFDKKFGNTYCLVNGRIETIAFLRNGSLLTRYKEENCLYNEDTPVTIEPFLPETGLYQNGSTQLYYLYRIPNRQWKKSFHTENYRVAALYGSFTSFSDLFETCKYKKESTLFKNIAFIHQVAVGIYTDIGIKIVNKHFLDEAKELWPLYPCYLEVQDQT